MRVELPDFGMAANALQRFVWEPMTAQLKVRIKETLCHAGFPVADVAFEGNNLVVTLPDGVTLSIEQLLRQR
jgi:hypothetical protein